MVKVKSAAGWIENNVSKEGWKLDLEWQKEFIPYWRNEELKNIPLIALDNSLDDT